MGPGGVTAEHGMDIGPHPHIGLQTVTWLLEGTVLHRDSLGSEQLIRPGELNVMTAGHGVSHSEETAGVYRGRIHGVQLWVAQPSATRDGDAAFEHHADLPTVEVGACAATVFVGDFAGATSPARRDTDHVGVDLDLRAGAMVLPLVSTHEYALVVFDGDLIVGDATLTPGHLGYVAAGRDELPVRATDRARALLIGGEPFPEPVLMWWNYVARDRAEIETAHGQWSVGDPRFGRVASSLDRITVGPPPWPTATR